MIYFGINNAHGPTRPWPDQSHIACYGPGSKASYIQQLAKAGSLLMYHGEQSDFLISRTLTKSTQSVMITSDYESSEDEDCSIRGTVPILSIVSGKCSI